jgi:hypothetical protein
MGNLRARSADVEKAPSKRGFQDWPTSSAALLTVAGPPQPRGQLEIDSANLD